MYPIVVIWDLDLERKWLIFLKIRKRVTREKNKLKKVRNNNNNKSSGGDITNNNKHERTRMIHGRKELVTAKS
jgi:hypothetical protein